MPDWIPCSIQKPTSDLKRILVFSILKNIHILHFDYEEWCLDETDFGSPGAIIEFTHWMPLPEIPFDISGLDEEIFGKK